MAKHYSYFVQIGDDDRVSTGRRSLQIYSDVPVESIARSPVAVLDVARWSGDGCELYDTPVQDDRGVHRGRCRFLWDGVGTDVPYESQYFPFVPVGEPGAFEAISEEAAGRKRVDRITFAGSGSEVTLTRSYIDEPTRTENFRFRRLSLEAI